MSVAELKTLVKRPDVVEVWVLASGNKLDLNSKYPQENGKISEDTTASDPRLLVYLKACKTGDGVAFPLPLVNQAYRNTVAVPKHWSSDPLSVTRGVAGASSIS